MRRVILIAFLFALVLTIYLLIADPDNELTPVLEIVAVGLFVVYLLLRLVQWLYPRRTRPPRSQIAEIERLYFRAMREMLNDEPNIPQVMNDLQRILSIDPHYKNARHYLNRARILMSVDRSNGTGSSLGSNIGFIELQEKLIDPDASVRKAVVMELIQYGEVAVDPLIALLMDPDPDVRVHAATALGWVGGRDAVQPLLVALQDENLSVRRYAARAMCWVVDSIAVDQLIAALQDEDSYVRSYAARALGWSHDERAIQPLIELYQTEENADVREYVVVALEDLGEKEPTAPEAA